MTGSAAIYGLRGKDYVDCFIMFPEGRVSEIQERQMTTVPDANIRCVSVEGSFDDCQDIVKAAFADQPFRCLLDLLENHCHVKQFVYHVEMECNYMSCNYVVIVCSETGRIADHSPVRVGRAGFFIIRSIFSLCMKNR